MSKPNRIHLLGNHDLSYWDQKHMCAGYAADKKMAIDAVGINWSQLWQFVWIDDWLVTHAGLSNDFYKAYSKEEDNEDPNKFLRRMCADKDLRETLYSVSSSRGGQDEYGGIVWCDEREFKDIPGVQQIFGHTVGDFVRKGEYHFCIDTALNHYAIYDHDKSEMIIKDTSDKLLFAYEDGEI